MAAFHVFVEGATDDTPAGLSRLADAIAKHYGLPSADLSARLQKGRFRVKGNIDRATAESYVRDLGRLGARCTIEEATPANSQKSTPLPFPAVKPPAESGGARPSSPALPAASTRPSTPPPTSGQPFQSGLSAAFSGEMPAADLGALGKTGASFALSSVDGADESAPASASASAFEPAGGGGIPASIGPVPEQAGKPTSGKVAKAKPKDEPVDLFAPPEMQGEEFKVDIASDEVDPRNRTGAPPSADDAAPQKPSSQRIPTTPTSSQKLPKTPASQKLPTTPAGRGSQPSIPVDVVIAVRRSSKFGPLGDERVRFVAGVFLAVLLGFIPAHFVAKLRETAAYETIDKKVIAAHQQAETPELYVVLDRTRADQLDRKKSEQRNAALIGFALWALVGGAIAFVWFKKIPWDD